MMQSKLMVAGALLGALAVLAFVAGPAQAGMCVPMTVKGRGADPAPATTQALIKLTRRAASTGGKVENSSTDCQKGPPGGFVWHDLGDRVPLKQIAAFGGR